MIGTVVAAKCRRCGNSFPADQLVLDSVYGMMVCQLCVKERKARERAGAKPKEVEEQQESMPAGWDEEDKYLELLNKTKNSQQTAKAERISDDKVRYTCPKCNYKFSYNIITKTPSSCPYCNKEIARFSF